MSVLQVCQLYIYVPRPVRGGLASIFHHVFGVNPRNLPVGDEIVDGSGLVRRQAGVGIGLARDHVDSAKAHGCPVYDKAVGGDVIAHVTGIVHCVGVDHVIALGSQIEAASVCLRKALVCQLRRRLRSGGTACIHIIVICRYAGDLVRGVYSDRHGIVIVISAKSNDGKELLVPGPFLYPYAI